MDDSRKQSIDDAFRRYRETVEKHNLAILKIIVDGITSQSAPVGMSEQTATAMQLRALSKYVGSRLDGKISEPKQVFSMDLRLDGVYHQPVESRQTWFDTISTHLGDVSFPPADLAHLCTLTKAIIGPGLEYWRQLRQIDMLSACLTESSNVTRGRVVVPASGNDVLDGLWDHEIKAGVRIGNGPQGWSGTYILYCRKDGDWAWKYAVHDEEWASDVFDTLEEFLDFYSHFREPTEQEARKAGSVRWMTRV